MGTIKVSERVVPAYSLAANLIYVTMDLAEPDNAEIHFEQSRLLLFSLIGFAPLLLTS